MYQVEMVTLLGGERRLSDDQVTDVIEALIDELDRVAAAPSVGTCRRGDEVEMTVAIEVDEGEEWEALARAVSTVRAAFRAAGIGRPALQSRDLRSHVTPLAAA